MRSLPSFFFLLLLGFVSLDCVQSTDLCSPLQPCATGCCSSAGHCGFGPDFCGAGCQGSCDAVAECGQYAPANSTSCPLNVCCDKWGFCGTTPEFCGDGCQSGCLPIIRPSCSANGDAMALSRRIAYYETWAVTRNCDAFEPESIRAGALTHINIAFAEVDSNFKITDTNGDIVARVSSLKRVNPGLRVNIAIGGWAFNDPPTQAIFSNMASTYPNRQTFINSIVRYLQKYGLDGVDIDWEYPVADDRGGQQVDYLNYVLLLSEMRETFGRTDPGWEITATLPSSYWYLRGFDLNAMQKYVDWFNVMTYDIHGLWDQKNIWTGPYLKGHTNVTEIDEGLDLLWKNGVQASKVVMGFGFYGRSFTMTDPNCYQPGCTFTAAGIAGDCTGQAGILSYSEVVSRNGSLSSVTYYDHVSTVKYTVYSGNQWISYDDAQSFGDKMQFLSSRCISGLMIWAIDQDTMDYQALTGLLGEKAMEGSLLQGGDLTIGELGNLADEFAAYTGENCYVTPKCTDGSSSQKGPDQVCKAGYTSVETAHSPHQNANYTLGPSCTKGSYHHICCPTKALPKNCAWNGAPQRSEFGCSGKCGPNQFLLNTDTYKDAFGQGSCFTGHRNLCCDSTEVLDVCSWTGCQDPRSATCPTGVKFTTRFDNGDGVLCDNRGVQAFCCPTTDTYKNCRWTTEYDSSPEHVCHPSSCTYGTLQITTSQDPSIGGPNADIYSGGPGTGGSNIQSCASFPLHVGQDPNFKYCCNPPSQYNNKWPVDPKYLWSNYHNAKGDDVLWNFSDDYGNNNMDSGPSDPTSNPGDDPYGFVMLDGPPNSIDTSFSSSFTVVRSREAIPMTKRSLITPNKTVIEATFDHAEETIYVYCNFPADSPRCRKVFLDGAADTIIKLPDHVGEGPFARIVSMERATTYDIPSHHIRARELSGNKNGIYKVVFDYDFHLIKRDSGPVNIRVDYTNLLPYWKEVTNSPATKKRSVFDERQTYKEWRTRVGNAKREHSKLQKKASETASENLTNSSATVNRRWYGVFVDWLKKLTTVTKEDQGSLTMGVSKSIVLYSGRANCQYGNAQLTAALDIVTDAKVQMESRWAYYFSGTIVPLDVTDTYAYFGVQPQVDIGLRINGDAELDWPSDRVKIIDTLSYPGLSIKGIAAVGPTLDIYGQLRGTVKLSGQLQIGSKFNFKAAEVYYGDKDEIDAKFGDLSNQLTSQEGLQPRFSAGVQASVQLDVIVTPEAKLGLKIGGGLGPIKGTLMDAQLVAFVNSTLRFYAQFLANTNNGQQSASYSYGVFLLYNIGYSCYATFPFSKHWATGLTYLYPNGPMQIDLYPLRTISLINTRKRDVLPTISAGPRRGLLSGRIDPIVDEDGYSGQHSDKDRTLGESNRWMSNGTSLEYSSFRLLQGRDLSGNSALPTGGLQCTNEPSPCAAAAPNPGKAMKRAWPGGASPTNCNRKLPVFQYNCVAFFYNEGIQTRVNNRLSFIPGICTNVNKFLVANGLQNGAYTLTYSSNDGLTDRRRAQSCPTGFCLSDNTAYQATYGVTGLVTSCDEFPFASTEEGGRAYNGLARNGVQTGTQSLCVPIWQQQIQSACNAMLGTLSQNINAFNDPPIAPRWVPWNDDFWTTDSGFNEKIPYNFRVPQSAGVTDQEYANMISYRHKRNYTIYLAAPSIDRNPNQAWFDQDYVSASYNALPAAGTVIEDSTYIACAINTRGQTRYTYGNYNGYCYSGLAFPTPAGKTRPGVVSCKINFAGGPGPAKRSIGKFGEWDIESIEILDDPEHFIATPELTTDHPLLPAWRKAKAVV